MGDWIWGWQEEGREAGSGIQCAKRGKARKGIYFDEFKQNSGTWNGFQNMETDKEVKPLLIQQRQCSLRNTSNSSISFSRNFGEQENAQNSSLEILPWLLAAYTQHSDFLKLYFSCKITGGPQVQNSCLEEQKCAGTKLEKGSRVWLRSRFAHNGLEHHESIQLQRAEAHLVNLSSPWKQIWGSNAKILTYSLLTG